MRIKGLELAKVNWGIMCKLLIMLERPPRVELGAFCSGGKRMATDLYYINALMLVGAYATCAVNRVLGWVVLGGAA